MTKEIIESSSIKLESDSVGDIVSMTNISEFSESVALVSTSIFKVALKAWI